MVGIVSKEKNQGDYPGSAPCRENTQSQIAVGIQVTICTS